MSQIEAHPFVDYLQSLATAPKARRALQRGTRGSPGQELAMVRYVGPWITKNTSVWQEYVYYTIASLFALHPVSCGDGNLGDHLRVFVFLKPGMETSTERRLEKLFAAREPHTALVPLVKLLKTNKVPVDWDRLLRDLLAWTHPSKYVQKRWAASFWARRHNKEE